MFYVYELLDPRDWSTFYVGKGQGSRVSQHVRDAAAGRITNRAKHDRIAAILACGMLPAELIVARFESEDDALAQEATRIEQIGLDNLTNIRPCGTPTENAERIIRRCIELAMADIERAQSPEIVEFARETLEVSQSILERACPA